MTHSPESFPSLVSTKWLATRLVEPDLRVLDASWYLPASGRDPAAEYAQAHIPGAVFFDLDAHSDPTSAVPHTLPSAAQFADGVGRLGISTHDRVVVYDDSGVNLSAARVWWMFRVFGHDRVAVLDGGLGKWRREGRPVEPGVVTLPPQHFAASFARSRLRDLEAMRVNAAERMEQVVDTRPADRFDGSAPEPRPGMRSGHIPGSLNLPFTELVGPDGTVLSMDALRERLAALGLDLTRPVVATCGSGTSACSLVLALHRIGKRDVALYDGSWSEWGARDDTPVETGRG